MPKDNPEFNPVSGVAKVGIVRTENLHTHTHRLETSRGEGESITAQTIHFWWRISILFLSNNESPRNIFTVGWRSTVVGVSWLGGGKSETRHDLRVPKTGSHWKGDENGTRPLDRVADTWPPGASSGQALQKKDTSWPSRSLPAPRTNLSLLGKKGQSTGVKCKAAATIET